MNLLLQYALNEFARQKQASTSCFTNKRRFKSVTINDMSGFLPPRVLKANVSISVSDAFAAISPHDIAGFLSQLNLSRAIKVVLGFQVPVIEKDDDGLPLVIVISEGYLAWIWICCYCVFTRLQVLQRKGDIINNSELDIAIEEGHGLSVVIQRLMNQDLSWPQEIISPEWYPEELEHYVGQINGLFTSTLQFALLHEIGHAAGDHFSSTNKVRPPHDLEREADMYALNTIKHYRDGQEASVQNSINHGACITFLTPILLGKNPWVPSTTHPTLLDRLNDMLLQLSPDENASSWTIVSDALLNWNQGAIPIVLPDTAITPREIYTTIHKEISGHIANQRGTP